MANPYDTYRHQRAASWTRVDMIVALYDETLNRIEEATEALNRDNQIESRQQCLRILRLIACLRSGVDAEAGSLSQNVLRLYNFVDRCVTSGTRQDLELARKILSPVRESFHEIRDTVAGLEKAGEIPGLHFQSGAECFV